MKTSGIYSTTVHVFSPGSSHEAKLGIYVNRMNGGGEEKLCDAVTTVVCADVKSKFCLTKLLKVRRQNDIS